MRKKEVPVLYFYGLHLGVLALAAALTLQLTGTSVSLGKLLFPGPDVVTIAHRGASAYAPENTLAAFRTGIRMNADYLEMDLQMTSDGEIVIMHDETVNRTTDGRGRVKNMTLAQIKALDAGSWFNEQNPMYAHPDFEGEQVPTLREVFEAFGDDVRYMLETKEPADYPGMEEKILELVEEFRLEREVAVQSFSKASLKKIHAMNDEIDLFQLIWYNRQAHITDNALKEIQSYAAGIGPNFNRMGAGYVQKVKEAGLLVFPYTVNYQVNMAKAMSLGVDGVHTNYPDRFHEVIEQYLDGE